MPRKSSSKTTLETLIDQQKAAQAVFRAYDHHHAPRTTPSPVTGDPWEGTPSLPSSIRTTITDNLLLQRKLRSTDVPQGLRSVAAALSREVKPEELERIVSTRWDRIHTTSTHRYIKSVVEEAPLLFVRSGGSRNNRSLNALLDSRNSDVAILSPEGQRGISAATGNFIVAMETSPMLHTLINPEVKPESSMRRLFSAMRIVKKQKTPTLLDDPNVLKSYKELLRLVEEPSLTDEEKAIDASIKLIDTVASHVHNLAFTETYLAEISVELRAEIKAQPSSVRKELASVLVDEHHLAEHLVAIASGEAVRDSLHTERAVGALVL